jgi:acylglycerol lipase
MSLRSSKPDESPVAKLIFIHGFNDHVGRYYELFPSLASRGIIVHALDQRGWGKSVKTNADRGKTGPTSQVISDIAHFIQFHLPSDVPLFVMGHSLGGGQVLTLATEPEYEDLVKQIDGWVLESPFIAFPKGLEPNFIEVFAGTLVSKILPNMTRFSALPPENVTRDPEVVKSINEDKLLHGYATLQGLAHMLQRTKALGEGVGKTSPSVKNLWLVHGPADKGTSYEASKKWFDDHGERPGWTFKSYEGWSHQLHADLPETRNIFAQDVGDWILARAGDKSGKSKL